MNRCQEGARHPRGDRFQTGAGNLNLESGLNAVRTIMRPMRYFSAATKANGREHTQCCAETGRLSAGSRTTGVPVGARLMSSWSRYPHGLPTGAAAKEHLTPLLTTTGH